MSFNAYLAELRKNLAKGDATELTHRRALQNLLDALGDKVSTTNEGKAIHNVGRPDVTVRKGAVTLGYVETKDIGVDLKAAEKSDQLKRYRNAFPNLILTDYVEFRWFVGGALREKVSLGTFDGKAIKSTRKGIEEVKALLGNFLVHEIPFPARPKELAERMAHLAHMVRDIISDSYEEEKHGPDVGHLHEELLAFRKYLIPDLKPGDFADMYAQTVAYGLFAARCAKPDERSFTRQAAWELIPKTNPMLRKLFNRIAGPDLDKELRWIVDELAEVLDRTDMHEVLRDFGKRTKQEDPVVHFYETFLAAYDPKLRETRGVYYTPEPVVSFIVRSIDKILQDKFGRSDGLADTNTLILDPAAGTASFLYRVIDDIHERIVREKKQGGTWSDYVSKHILPRTFGFELLMAPYAMAHLKLGLLLQESGYDFRSDERLGIYLTNTLEEGIEKARALGFAGFITEEGNAAARIKNEELIEVILGNPPYSGHSANKGEWITKLLKDTYYHVDGKPLKERNPKWLQDDYVKFIRFAQWRIEKTGRGVLGFISNHAYLDNPTFRGMRQSLMKTFDEIYILDLHGNERKKEVCPDGSPDKNIFDIQQGVAIGLFVKSGGTGFQPVDTGYNPVPPSENDPQSGGTGFQPVSEFQATRRNLPHWQQGGAAYFLTFRLRHGELSMEERKKALEACLHWNGKKWKVHAAVIMPDHVHLLATPLEKSPGKYHSLSEILHSVKRHSARVINKARGQEGSLWLDETFDRIVRDKKEFEEKWNYIAQNAVEKGLADAPEKYPFYWYEGKEEDTGYNPVPPRIYHADLWGLREAKCKALSENDVKTVEWKRLEPQSPFYLFVPQDTERLEEYQFPQTSAVLKNIDFKKIEDCVRALEAGASSSLSQILTSEKFKKALVEATTPHFQALDALEKIIDRIQSEDHFSNGLSAIGASGDFVTMLKERIKKDPIFREMFQSWKITDIFPVNSVGIVTARDHFVIDFEKNALRRRIEAFRDSNLSDDEIRQKLNLKDSKAWKLSNARKVLQQDKEWQSRFTQCLYRPFDVRHLYYHDAIVERSREEVMRHMLAGENLSMCVGRAGQVVGGGEWNIVYCGEHVEDFNLFYRGGNVNFPLYLYEGGEEETLQAGQAVERKPNLNPDFVKALETRLGLKFSGGTGFQPVNTECNSVPPKKEGFSPEDIFHYIYAVFHSPTYRTRYAEFLKIDFPRVPLTSSRELFFALAELGEKLVKLHLMESPELDKPITSFPESGDSIVEKVRYVPATGYNPVPLREETSENGGTGFQPVAGKIFINKTQFFEGVEPDVWEFHIGGYQVLQKWLKDRKGRKLSYDDITHYQKIVVALAKTMEIMKAIDKKIGKWPVE